MPSSKKPFSNVNRASDPVRLHYALVSALTAYDAREEAKVARTKYGRHNHYALSHYFAALERTETAVASGTDIRDALLDAFSGRLLNSLLRTIHEPIATREEEHEHAVRWSYGA